MKTRTHFSTEFLLLNELTGYADLTIPHEIWLEHSLVDTEQKAGGEFFYFKYFPRGSQQKVTWIFR